METIETSCGSCGNTFQRERKRGRPATKCQPCRDKVATALAFSQKAEVVDGVTWIQAVEPCRDCGSAFMRPKKRGKPPVRCEDCRSKLDAEKAAEVTVSDEKLDELFKGDRFLLQGTPSELPRGAEAQCPSIRLGKCGRIFTSNSACDEHKKWLPNGSYECIDPATLGMEPRSRVRDADKETERIIPVWTRPTVKEGE